MTLFWTKTWEALASALFPTACVSCQDLIAALDPPLCASCWASLPVFAGPLCPCGSPLPGSPTEKCGRCRRGRSVISRGASLGPYAGALGESVRALKYRRRHRSADRLSERLVATHTCQWVLRGAGVLVPVPLHAKQQAARGFNQAKLLASAVSRRSGVPVSESLVRTRETPSQTRLSARARRNNVRDAFAFVPSQRGPGMVAVLVDDVTTTGATIRECARVLVEAGAREVRSITVARAE